MSTETLGRSAAHYLQTNWRTVTRLPEPGITYRAVDLPDDMQGMVKQLKVNGIIRAVDYIKEHGSQYTEYRTRQQPYEYAQQVKADHDPDRLPCGHAFRIEHNRDGRIECKHRDCDASWPADILQEYMAMGGDVHD